MKIVSKIKDFYDYLQQYGIDEKIVYIRNNKVIEEKDKEYIYFKELNKLRESILTIDENKIRKIYNVIFFGINNKVYLGLYESGYANMVTSTFTDTNKYYWKEDVLKIFKKIIKQKSIYNANKLIKLYEKFKDGNTEYEYIFKELNTPCFIFGTVKNIWIKPIINPILRFYNIQKYFPAEFVYNEIYNWLSLHNQKEIVEIADKYKIEQHGFDKYSFRNTKPSEKKQRRKLNKQLKKQK